jgi:hypothetical protein
LITSRTRQYLSQILPQSAESGLHSKPEKPASGRPPAGRVPAEKAPPEMLAAIVSFLRQYLVCDDHQLTLLALWVVYTRCFEHFSSAVYLNLRSPESQCGKTLCLELLEILCDFPWLATGPTPQSAMASLLTGDRRIRPNHEDEDKEKFVHRPPFTILFDDCHHTLGLSERQPLLALLNSGSRATGRYVSGRLQYCVFGPRAFAGSAPLPRSLATRCIPIVLRRRRPADAIKRFDPDEARASVVDLLKRLAGWIDKNSAKIADAARSAPRQLPSNFTFRRQACAEPLLHIAEIVGGPWPQRACLALTAIFNLSESGFSVQLLHDIRAAFASKNNPEYLTTSDLLALLATLDDRPWSDWQPNSGRRLGMLLHPFGIVALTLRTGPETVLRGYRLSDFQDAWERYLPPLCSTTDSLSATPSATVFSAIHAGCSM